MVNALLVASFGESARLTPLRGADGGIDGELVEPDRSGDTGTGIKSSIPPGGTLFQAKFHYTTDARLTDLRRLVTRQFENELQSNRQLANRKRTVGRFIVVTNVPASHEAQLEIIRIRQRYLHRLPLRAAEVWWKEAVTALLDQHPSVWISYPAIFAGRRIPTFAHVIANTRAPLPRKVRMALSTQFERDKNLRFRQIELAKDISELFTDLEITFEGARPLDFVPSPQSIPRRASQTRYAVEFFRTSVRHHGRGFACSALNLLLIDHPRRLLLEGGPGQGKSTLTQMVAQIFRAAILGNSSLHPESRWAPPRTAFLPLRVDLKAFGERIAARPETSLDQFIADLLTADAGGATLSVEELHDLLENAPVALILDGLDEIGSDVIRDAAIEKALEAVERFEKQLNAQLRSIVTSRPPAVEGRRKSLESFVRAQLLPMDKPIVNKFVERWLRVQLSEPSELERVRGSFIRRREERHVAALSRNPMQLSVLLHFIHLKGEAFPDRRAELYRDYFQIVIDRDVEKSPDLRSNREIIEALHRFLGFSIHQKTEIQEIDGSLPRKQLLGVVSSWLAAREDDPGKAQRLFRLGEERLGMIVVLTGEGDDASYGFEIQPVREYFAAAHLSDDLPGEQVHDLFEALVRRPFWREVALFLAGLRRPNEKADLISRARNLDSSDAEGWRQDGRSVIGELLVEGALSEPRHVYLEGVRFLVEALDVVATPFQREPENLAPVLPHLATAQGAPDIPRRLLELTERDIDCGDPYRLRRLFSVAKATLAPPQVVELLARADIGNKFVQAEIALESYEAVQEMRSADLSNAFWKLVTPREWAGAICRHWSNELPTGVPGAVHRELFNIVASVPLIPTFGHRRSEFYESSLAAPYLAALMTDAAILADPVNSAAAHGSASRPIVSDLDELDYSGLSPQARTIARECIDLLQLLVGAATSGEHELFVEVIDQAHELAHEPRLLSGLPGWLVAKTVALVIQLAERSAMTFGDDVSDQVEPLILALNPFFMGEDSSSTNWPIKVGFEGLLPQLCVDKGRCVSTASAIKQLIVAPDRSSALPTIPLSGSLLKSTLLGLTPSQLKAALPRLGVPGVVWQPMGLRLGAPLIKKILSCGRDSDDSLVICATLTLILGSRFHRMLPRENFLRLLQYSAPVSEELGAVLRGTFFYHNDQRMGETADYLEWVLREIAKAPTCFPFALRCAAAEFLIAEVDKHAEPLPTGFARH